MKSQSKTKSINQQATTKTKTSTDRFVKNEGVVETWQHIFSQSKKQRTLQDLFKEALLDIYSAEKQMVNELPKILKAVETSALKKIFSRHLNQTKRQAIRLERLLSLLKIETGNKPCKAMQGLIEESEEVIKNFPQGLVRDSALVMAAQKAEHYEIASYASLCELADVLALDTIYNELIAILEEEIDTDNNLTKIGKSINEDACEC